jgi:hypothetical protein
LLKWGAVAGVAVVVAPLLFTLLAATVALVATAAIAMVTVAVAPVFSMKLANWKMAAILAEARRNPIPTLENELLLRKRALEDTAGQLRWRSLQLTRLSIRPRRLRATIHRCGIAGRREFERLGH